MRTDDGPHVPDDDLTVHVWLQHRHELIDVSAVRVHHVQMVEAVDRGDLVDREGTRLAGRSWLAPLLALAVAYLDDRLYRQRRGQQGLRPADPAAFLEV